MVFFSFISKHFMFVSLFLFKLYHQLSFAFRSLCWYYVMIITSKTWLRLLNETWKGYHVNIGNCTYLGQNSSASSKRLTSFLKTFLHFLQARIISGLFIISWSSFSWWHSAQSYHFLQHYALIWTCALRMCLHIFVKFKFYII